MARLYRCVWWWDVCVKRTSCDLVFMLWQWLWVNKHVCTEWFGKTVKPHGGAWSLAEWEDDYRRVQDFLMSLMWFGSVFTVPDTTQNLPRQYCHSRGKDTEKSVVTKLFFFYSPVHLHKNWSSWLTRQVKRERANVRVEETEGRG